MFVATECTPACILRPLQHVFLRLLLTGCLALESVQAGTDRLHAQMRLVRCAWRYLQQGLALALVPPSMQPLILYAPVKQHSAAAQTLFPSSPRSYGACPAAAQALEPLLQGPDRLAAGLAAVAAEERVWRAERVALQAALAGGVLHAQS